MQVDAVVWDFGNVLIRWDPLPAIAAGVGDADARAFLGSYDFGSWNYAQDAGRTWAQALTVLETEAPEWLAAGAAYVDNFPLALLGPVPGTHELVRELAAAGVPQVGLTNWSAELYPHAPATYDVIELFRDVVVSGQERLAKPDPAIYRLVAERAGIPLERLAFIDDSVANVAAAAAAGMQAFQFTGAEQLRRDLVSLGLPL
ncbi:HAD-IA family hydrolase [Nocardioides panzhihuensis]|uniref:2-haloacid dehalogenase n=1 Tax=Nocardioides panzhihuensis TaxID=860243 RepID=A0A7Z0DPN6_9ACTN|nr:HAD-IA family hydrolase [Nocardioides panzhihuensis]NYI79337.1 2-haloacid dehalogenase [Nocardioides panzhihuensis]